MTLHAMVRVLPWFLVAIACTLFLFAPGADGPLIVLGWLVVFGTVRAIASRVTTREGRLALDGLLVFGCLLAAFEGGWFLVPAALAFAWSDRRPSMPHATPRNETTGPEVLAGLGAAGAGLAGVGVILFGPLQSAAASSISGGTIVEGAVQPASLAAGGLLPRTVIVLGAAAALSVIIAVAAVVHARRRVTSARRVLAVAVIALGAIALLGAFTIGIFLLPAVGLGVAAWLVGSPARRTSRRSAT
jgi:hypothetical protein